MKLSHLLLIILSVDYSLGKKFRYYKSKSLNKQYKNSLVDVFAFLGRFEATELDFYFEEEGKQILWNYLKIFQ